MEKHIFLFLIWIFGFQLELYSVVEVRSTRLTTSDGLPNNSIRCVYQDSKGFIWMGTQNGLSRYDGNSFITFRPQGGEEVSLADHRIKSLIEDKNGFLWISTHAKLFSCYDLKKGCFVDFTGCGEYMDYYDLMSLEDNGDVWFWGKYNGCRKVSYQDGSFKSVVFDRNTGLASNYVISVAKDADHGMWIATDKGLYYWDHTNLHAMEIEKSFKQIQSYKGHAFFVTSDGTFYVSDLSKKIKRIAGFQKERHLKITGGFSLDNKWMLFTNTGGYSFDFNTFEIRRAEAPYDIPNVLVNSDNKKNYWLNNNTGVLYYVNAKTGKVKEFQVMPKEKIDLIDSERYYIYHDSRDIIWITTYGNGLFAYDLKTEQLSHFLANVDNVATPIGSDFLQSVAEDRSGNIWVSAEFTGVACLKIINKGAQRIYPKGETDVDRSNAVRMIDFMEDENVAISTRGGEFYIYNKDLTSMVSKKSFHNNLYSLEEDASGTKWYAFRGNGVLVGEQLYKHNDTDSSSLSIDQIFCMLKDRKGRMWLGTFGGGLELAVKEGEKYHFRHFFRGLYGQERVRALCEDRNGWIWVGTSGGLFVFNPEELLRDSRSYYHYTLDKGDLYSNEIRSIVQDSEGCVWIAETGSGFSMCTSHEDYDQLKFMHYNTSDGLVNSMVQCFVEDMDGMIWIPTEYGISCFNPAARTFENYFFSSNMLGNVYSENCGLRLHDGRLAFGTNFGLTVVDPRFIERASSDISATFTDLKLNGVSVRPGDWDSPLDSTLAYVSEINLKHFQNSFVLEFSTFDYMGTELSKFSYKLENYDQSWSVPSALNFAAYKNLPLGTYYLRVKVCSASGVWSEKESLMKIVVSPPFWKTGWAYLLYMLLLVGVLYLIYHTIHNMSVLRYKIKMEEQLTEYKLAFFTNISHEFRTPLTLIQGALEKMHGVNAIPAELVYSMEVMDKSTKRMLRLINQLLEFRKMQNNKLALSLEETDVIAFLYEIYLTFKDAAESKNMDFRFISSVPACKIFIDKGYVDKIAYNILSNAFKYSPSGGKINVEITVDEMAHVLHIKISDTGVGIPEEKRGELFKRFMQSSFSGNSVGVGLHLTRELVYVHKGTIRYEENPVGGSIFIVTLPTDASIYAEKDFLIPNNVLLKEKQDMEKRLIIAEEKDDTLHPVELPVAVPLNKYKILIVEDDNDVREFLKQELNAYFEVVAESDGELGLERARTYDADLIISDVLMPHCSGFELTKRLKNDFNTSHVPIILLTALHSSDNHLKGIECGADAYITKPFSTKLLLTRVIKLLEQRERLREKFSNDPTVERLAIYTSDKDKLFVEKLLKVMQSQLANTGFTVDEFAEMMGVGRSIFYRKVRGLTGYSPNEYIRIMRMRKAAELLRQDTHTTVAEVSYQVGIDDPYYFSRCFKQQFGITPSGYQKGSEEMPGNLDDKKENK